MRQVSPESISIYEFILEAYKFCDGDWGLLANETGISNEALDGFLDFAAVFLANVGNYYGAGDQKFTPKMSQVELEKVSTASEGTARRYQEFCDTIFLKPPYNLGFPSDVAQSSYYPGDLRISRDEISKTREIMEQNAINPENTRLEKKVLGDQKTVLDILQASAEIDAHPRELPSNGVEEAFRVVRGDHSEELQKICESLEEAWKYAANPAQKRMIRKYLETFRTGDVEAFKESQRIWVKDMKPAVETILGFVEPYRDPYGVRAEYEGLVGIVDPDETKVLTTLTENSTTFIRRLPWAKGYKENRGMGPLEKELFDPPDFTSLQDGFKNVLISNRQKKVAVLPNTALVDHSELEKFEIHRSPAWRIQITIHELFGHGTSKLLTQEGPNKYNFDILNPPISPLTGKPIMSWYKSKQTWTSVFGDLATTLDECRAECVGSYLLPDKELLSIFGFTDVSDVTADDRNYNVEDNKWGQAHDRAHFAMFRSLLAAGDDFMTIDHDVAAERLVVRIDRSKILTHGRPAIGDLLLKLHVYRCTADVDECRIFYEDLTKVEGIFLEYRELCLKKKVLKDIFVQANTILDDDEGVRLKEYEPTTRGMIQSWAERGV
ncbi:MAG: hypothetical protein M1837_000290 [Sclerophora amabilis]|nr:MAG: hypothetical protein M1837_000290 [Sclerophora amabilis]